MVPHTGFPVIRNRSDKGIASFAGDDRYIVDYLVEEVLQRQPEDVRSFLLQTSILDRMTGPLCDAVTGQAGGKAMLEVLDRGNLFLVPLDDRRKWYRYHHLFADVLRSRLLDEQPDRVQELHGRASDWYAQNGEPAEAIRHALAGEDFQRAGDGSISSRLGRILQGPGGHVRIRLATPRSHGYTSRRWRPRFSRARPPGHARRQ